MTKITRIFLDLDDVLNKFTLHALRSVGCEIKSMDYIDYPADVGFDIVAAANRFHPTKHDWYPEQFWGSIGRDVWRSTPVSNEFCTLLAMSTNAVGEGGVFIVTSPIDDPECDAGKKEWIRSNCPKWLYGQTFIGSHKYCLANRNSLLIDDNEENANKFEVNGGRSIRMPRPWNTNHSVRNNIDFIEKYFYSLWNGGCFA